MFEHLRLWKEEGGRMMKATLLQLKMSQVSQIEDAVRELSNHDEDVWS